MSSLSLKDALKVVVEDLTRLTPAQLRQELDAHSQGDVASALREVRAYLAEQFEVFHYPLGHIDALLNGNAGWAERESAMTSLHEWIAANDQQYLLAA